MNKNNNKMKKIKKMLPKKMMINNKKMKKIKKILNKKMKMIF